MRRRVTFVVAVLALWAGLSSCESSPTQTAAHVTSIGPVTATPDAQVTIPYTVYTDLSAPVAIDISLCFGGLRCDSGECLQLHGTSPRPPVVVRAGASSDVHSLVWNPACESFALPHKQGFTLCLTPDDNGAPLESRPLSLARLGITPSATSCP